MRRPSYVVEEVAERVCKSVEHLLFVVDEVYKIGA